MICKEVNKKLFKDDIKKTAINLVYAVFFISISFTAHTQKADSVLLEETYLLLDKGEYTQAFESVKSLSKSAIQNQNWKTLLGCQATLFEVGYYGELVDDVLPYLSNNHRFFSDNVSEKKNLSSYYIASLLTEVGDLISSIRAYKRLINPLKVEGNEDLLMGVYNNLGTIYTELGDYPLAIKYIEASKEINHRTKDKLGYSENIFNLALVYYYLDEYQKSEKLFREYATLNPEEEAYISWHIAEVKVGMNALDSARIYFAKAKRKESYLTEVEFNELYAAILQKEGNTKAATRFLRKNKEVIDASDQNRKQGKYYFQVGNLYAESNNLDSSFFFLDLSLKAFTDGQITIHTIDSLPVKSYLLNEIWIGEILMLLGRIYSEEYEDNKKEKKRKQAEQCISLALDALDYKRSFFEDMGSSIFASKKSKQLYESVIDIYLKWHATSGKDEYIDRALQVAQRHNAFLLRQQVNERIVLNQFGVEEGVQKVYIDQKLKVHELSHSLGQQYTVAIFDQYKKEKASLDSLTNQLYGNYPELQKAKENFEVATAQEIQEILPKNKAVIKYFEGEQKIYSFVITTKEIKYFVSENKEEINAQILQLRTLLSDFKQDFSKMDSLESRYLTLSYALFQNIISDALSAMDDRIDQLIIIPSGLLTQIPFESLVIRKSISWKTPSSYLIQDYGVAYNYFCKELTKKIPAQTLAKVISYGLEYDDYTLSESKKFSNDSISKQVIQKFRSEEMGHLYFADDEAKEVADMFDGVSYLNTEATKASFLLNVPNFDIVHLSAHSFVDFQYPSNSSIIFTKKDSLTDNLLKIKDIDRMRFDGQLFTLSACNTFYGKNNEGEGLSSMARAFIQSGAGSVVGSLWAVPDEISKAFMIRFYTKLKDGMSKDEALRATKLDYLTDDKLSSPIYRSPAYWSAWVVYGDSSAIKTSYTEYILVGLGILLIFIGFIGVRVNPNKR